MPPILVLFAHPALEKSRVHRRLLRELATVEGATLHDLYEAYPDFNVDVPREQELLSQHETVVLQHPLYWYSAPPLVKQWQDLVLEHGWAYGSQGRALRGKRFLSLISTGGPAAAYRLEGMNRHTIRQLLAPFEQTATLCGMRYLPPYVIHGTHRMEEPQIVREAARYRRTIELLRDAPPEPEPLAGVGTLNEVLADQLAEVGR